MQKESKIKDNIRIGSQTIVNLGVESKTTSSQRVRTIIQHCVLMPKPQLFAELINMYLGIQGDKFNLKHFNEVNQFVDDNRDYFYLPEGPEDYRSDMDDDHKFVADIH